MNETIFNDEGQNKLWASTLLRSGDVHVVKIDFVPKIEMHSIYNEAWKFNWKLVS